MVTFFRVYVCWGSFLQVRDRLIMKHCWFIEDVQIKCLLVDKKHRVSCTVESSFYKTKMSTTILDLSLTDILYIIAI